MNCPACQTKLVPGATFCPECGTRLPETHAPLKVLQDRYELTKKLGEGGMGAVFLANDRRLSTARWAVKELSDTQITTPLERQQAAENFRQEAEMLAGLVHPNLPRVTDSFTEDGRNYLVMEFVPGETLHNYMLRVGLPRPLPEVLEWARQLCDVLHYLHSRQPPVIFRDLKPANLMLTPERTLKLIDFGIARHFKAGQARDTQAFGTVGYSAPEQYGRGQTDARSDIYSLSVLLHQLLTGHDPATTPFRLPPAIELNPSLPETISAVLAQGMNNDPEQRFPSMTAFQQALLGTGNLVKTQGVEVAATMLMGSPALPQTHYGDPNAGVGAPTGTPKSTRLALWARWVGIVSVSLMALAFALIVIAFLSGNVQSTLGSLGLVLALLPLLLGPIATVLGLIALFQKTTQATTSGRRDAIIGIATGLLTLLLCCGITPFFSPSSTTSSQLERASPMGALAGQPGSAASFMEARNG